MKSSFLWLFGLLVPWFSAAQGVKVRVVSGTEPLPYSYVYVNGRPVCSADSSGSAVIPSGKLRAGDTLSASYAGMRGEKIVCTGQSAEWTIPLSQGLVMPEFTITGKAGNVIVRKEIRFPKVYPAWSEFHGLFTANTADDVPIAVAGSFVVGNICMPDGSLYRGRDQIIDAGGIPATGPKLADALAATVHSAEDALFLQKSMFGVFKIRFNDDIRFTRCGTAGELELYMVTRPFATEQDASGQSSFQTLLRVDTQSREIRSAEVHRIDGPAGYDLTFTADYVYDARKQICPVRIEGVYTDTRLKQSYRLKLEKVARHGYSPQEFREVVRERKGERVPGWKEKQEVPRGKKNR